MLSFDLSNPGKPGFFLYIFTSQKIICNDTFRYPLFINTILNFFSRYIYYWSVMFSLTLPGEKNQRQASAVFVKYHIFDTDFPPNKITFIPLKTPALWTTT